MVKCDECKEFEGTMRVDDVLFCEDCFYEIRDSFAQCEICKIYTFDYQIVGFVDMYVCKDCVKENDNLQYCADCDSLDNTENMVFYNNKWYCKFCIQDVM